MALSAQKSTTSVANRKSSASCAFVRPAACSISAAGKFQSSKVAGPRPFAPVQQRKSHTVTVKAVAEPVATKGAEKVQYYALLSNAEFMLNDVNNESVAEQLRERVRYFNEQNKERDFWLVVEPKWLDQKYPDKAKMVGRPCVALVSTDKLWIVYMKLRLDRVLRIDLGEMPKEEVLAVGGTLPEFKPPAKWTAPYSRYTYGWWEKFFPGN